MGGESGIMYERVTLLLQDLDGLEAFGRCSCIPPMGLRIVKTFPPMIFPF